MSGFVREIRQNSIDSQQSSGSYVLTFLRWSNRDVYNYTNFEDSKKVREPLTVINDAIQVTVSNDKKSLAPTATVALKGGDVNYAASVHPGDFLLVNMLNWPADAVRVQAKAQNTQPINELGDGFKGVFKIQSVVKNITVSPTNGVKSVTFVVTAAGFTEFNNSIYYNPAIAAEFRDRGKLLWSLAIGEFWQDFLKTNVEVQDILKALFKILIGKSYKDPDSKVRNFGNTKFIIPSTLGKLLGKPNINFASELYNYVIGIWGASKSAKIVKNLGEAMNPGITQEKEPNFFITKKNGGSKIQGDKFVSLEDWNQKSAWSILKSYSNETLNEMYTTYRLGIDNKVHPTVIIRQKPFTTEHFEPPQPSSKFPVTRFLNLPRWKISTNLLKSAQLSKNDAARFNFVQVYTYILAATVNQDMASQISRGNFVSDDKDIERNGLRPYVVRANFDFPDGEKNKNIRAPEWAKILSDWIIDGHLKESGTLTFHGIQDPISIGDNIELDNIVYHIESISHSISIGMSGLKKFETRMSVSYGMDKRSSKDGPRYANMDFPQMIDQLEDDYKHERILPGISDSQDLPNSSNYENGERIARSPNISFHPPQDRKVSRKTSEANTGIDDEYGKLTGGQSLGKKKND